MKKPWTIVNVDEKVRKIITDKAKDYGCSIAYLLALEFDEEPEPRTGKTWTLWNFDPKVSEDIIRQAKTEKLNVPKYLIKLHKKHLKDLEENTETPKQIEKRVRKEADRDIRDYLKDFIKSY